ncbi:MAG: hypothetical protein P1U74_03610 [Legionellaceae bacterium]|nr:hypothetical protein [Legionellaceae bacterium]
MRSTLEAQQVDLVKASQSYKPDAFPEKFRSAYKDLMPEFKKIVQQHGSYNKKSIHDCYYHTLQHVLIDTMLEGFKNRLIASGLTNTNNGFILKRLIMFIKHPLFAISARILQQGLDDIDEHIIPFVSDTTEIFTQLLNEYLQEKIEQEKSERGENRLLVNEDRRLRRLDSLAQLLELNSRVSVCSAVSIYDEKLLLAVNNSGNTENDEILHLTLQKLRMIRDFIKVKQSVRVAARESYETEEFFYQESLNTIAPDDEIEQFIAELQSISTSTQDLEALKKAIKKLLKTFCLDNGTFSDEERAVFLLGQFTILLPESRKYTVAGTKTQNSYLFMNKYLVSDEYTIFGPETQDVGDYPSYLSRLHLHAEQLILKFLIGAGYTEGVVGISKSCCLDCHNVFQKEEHRKFITRGTSGVNFPGTVEIHTSSFRENVGSPSRKEKICGQHESPDDTPGSSEKKDSRFFKRAKREESNIETIIECDSDSSFSFLNSSSSSSLLDNSLNTSTTTDVSTIDEEFSTPRFN